MELTKLENSRDSRLREHLSSKSCARNDAFSFWALPEQWKPALCELNKSSEQVISWFLYEEYLAPERRRPPRTLRGYYIVKQLLPIGFRFYAKSWFVRMRPQIRFPSWPIEPALINYLRAWISQALNTLKKSDGYHIDFWPDGKRCCIVLTHDVESPKGLQLMERMADLEERWGFLSSWNLPLAQYPIDWTLVDKLRARGFEFGAHGLSHDGRLFRSQKDFLLLAPLVEELARNHHLRGFRSPSTLRIGEWIGTLDFDYDSSFADTDPYEPQPGGCCSVFPYFLGNVVELPYTLPQDHTLIHLLRRDPLPVWKDKARWIASIGGMILVLVHPDYMGEPPYLHIYEELLRFLADFNDAWKARPSEVARWWRNRASLTLSVADGSETPRIIGREASRARAVPLSQSRLVSRD